MRITPRLALRSAAGLMLLAAAFAFVPALADKPSEVLDGPKATTITAIPIDFDRENPERKEFGKLLWRGGLNLFGKTHFFGGYSGLAIDPSGRSLLAISDAGLWLKAEIAYDGRRIKGLNRAVLGPILGPDGKPVRSEAERDTEAVAPVSGNTTEGTAFVSFEREHAIKRYPFTADRFGPPSDAIRLPAGAKAMNPNQGIEAIAYLAAGRLKGTLVAFSERRLDKRGNLQGWLIGGPNPGAIALKRLGGFDITDVAPLPDGGIVVLERRFRYSEGVKMRIRRIAESELKPGSTMEGEVLLEAADNLNIDNMEAIAAHRANSGETILTLMSDDNYNAFQRTLIMQFAMPEPVVAGASSR
jgi:hypothetical protein